ncbi:membrane-associated protein, putative [Bodo saltans]|uniref:Membrane-associated protein, putative n=1 Tax=Bodo saltans TaxID=75058 RepID=A0A0S4ITJ3_BODSA|nr:membrane-associated protein, putative [Bodo saltans]|eukprot:CUF74402.1 membrane-associated protein, putative [Bodo saltans]
MKFTSISMALVCAMLMKSAAATTQYVAPALTDSLSASSQAYLIGISSTFLFLVCAFMAVSALTGIDYSNDSLLVVDVEPTVDEQ